MEIIELILLSLLVLGISYLIFFKKEKSKDELGEYKQLNEFKTSISELIQNKFTEIIKENQASEKNLREEVEKFLKSFEDGITKSMKEKLDTMITNIESVGQKVDSKLQTIQKDNNEQLEKMRATVDEKLQTTLEKRLGESFKQVSERLEQVHKGLGEMQTLATGVGDLKKVLSNVKTRGTLGEVQLGNILEQILSPEQYDKNVKVKSGSSEVVEFAIKLPGKEKDKFVYIPVDSKFPLEKYHAVVDAYEGADPEQVKITVKELESAIMKSAKDIRDKYISVPETTDFGIMFLPIEGLYAEVVRTPGLLEKLQSSKVMVAGPTTLVAMLNSLQMGFRTLAIEKRSSEVRNILGAVKKEFDTFGAVLAKAQKKIQEADKEIDTLVTTRTTQIQRKLKDVQTDTLGLENIEPEKIIESISLTSEDDF